jgi:hypothetical protein
MEVRKIEARNTGNLTAVLGFKFSTFCDDTDFKNFPDDVYRYTNFVVRKNIGY